MAQAVGQWPEAVRHSIPQRVPVVGIGARQVFCQIGQAVAIRIIVSIRRVGRVQTMQLLPPIRHAIAVRVEDINAPAIICEGHSAGQQPGKAEVIALHHVFNGFPAIAGREIANQCSIIRAQRIRFQTSRFDPLADFIPKGHRIQTIPQVVVGLVRYKGQFIDPIKGDIADEVHMLLAIINGQLRQWGDDGPSLGNILGSQAISHLLPDFLLSLIHVPDHRLINFGLEGHIAHSDVGLAVAILPVEGFKAHAIAQHEGVIGSGFRVQFTINVQAHADTIPHRGQMVPLTIANVRFGNQVMIGQFLGNLQLFQDLSFHRIGALTRADVPVFIFGGNDLQLAFPMNRGETLL